MKRIAIKEMHIRNFKGVRKQDLKFGNNVLISGGNRKGKTTIYDAYLWCLFGQTSKANAVVQPLDVDNKIIHKLETSVVIILDANGRTLKVERKLTEKWHAKDTAEEKLKGTDTTRFIDDVPCSVRQFKDKLNEICDYDKWFMLSNISNFWSYKIEDRRKLLMSMAGEINESELAKDFPIVYKEMIEGHKELTDMVVQYKITKKKANDDLNTIPAKVSSLNSMRSDADFGKIRERKEELDAQINALDAELQGLSSRSYEQIEYQKRHDAFLKKMQEVEFDWEIGKTKTVKEIIEQINGISEELGILKRKQMTEDEINESNKKKLESLKVQFEDLKIQWNNVNEKKFGYNHTDVCPVCGRPYTDEMKAKEYENAVAEYNKQKSECLSEIQKEATEIKNRIAVLSGTINTYEQIDRSHICNSIEYKEQISNNLHQKHKEVNVAEWKDSDKYKEMLEELQAIEHSKPQEQENASLEQRRQKKAELIASRDVLTMELSGEELNKKIQCEEDKLNASSTSLAQTIIDCNEALRQISEYKKSKINMLSDKVNSYFSIVRWKFYEQNITNEDVKDICTALDENGIDYVNTNDGTVINMGVDIVNGISKAFDINVPLFVDRKESAEKIVETEQQTIFLMCIYGEPLIITNL